jgi:hypothetical protein
LAKLQIVELTENDQGDVYNLLFHNDVRLDDGANGIPSISVPLIAALLAGDWGLWRTCKLNLDRSLSNLDKSALDAEERALVAGRIERLRDRIDAEPKSMKWRMRDRIGDRVRWYAEPEEEAPGT